MSMVLSLVALGDANIARILRDPPLIWRIAAPDEPGVYEDARAEQRNGGLFARLFGRKSASHETIELTEDREGATVDLDKSWHGIHYLLTGTDWDGELPLGVLVGGEPVGDVEVGYGPARVLDSVQVGRVRDALRGIRDDDLRARFDPKVMIAKKIYPEIWDRDPAEDDSFGYLLENFRALRKFVDETAEAGLGVVVLMT